MPITNTEIILDSITMENIDDALFFYSTLLDMIMQKKKKYQKNEELLLKQMLKLDIKKEVIRLKKFESDSSDTSDTDTEIK